MLCGGACVAALEYEETNHHGGHEGSPPVVVRRWRERAAAHTHERPARRGGASSEEIDCGCFGTTRYDCFARIHRHQARSTRGAGCAWQQWLGKGLGAAGYTLLVAGSQAALRGKTAAGRQPARMITLNRTLTDPTNPFPQPQGGDRGAREAIGWVWGRPHPGGGQHQPKGA